MRRVDDLGLVVVQPVEQSLLDVSVDMRLGLFYHEEIGERLLDLLIFELEQLEGEVDKIGAAEAQLVDAALIADLRFADEQLERLE